MTAALDRSQQALVVLVQRPMRALAHGIARRFDTVDTDELAQVGSEVACEEVGKGKHDPSQASFLTMIWTRAQGEMIDYASKQQRASDFSRALRRGFAKVTEIASDLGDPLLETLEARAKRLAELQRAAVAAATLAVLSVSEDSLPPDVRLERAEEQARIRHLLAPALASLSTADRSLVWSACVDDVSVAELARQQGEPYDRVRYRFLRALEALGEALDQPASSKSPARPAGDLDATHFR